MILTPPASSPFLKSALLIRVIELLERLSNYTAALEVSFAPCSSVSQRFILTRSVFCSNSPQIIILILESSPDASILNVTIDCIKRCTEIWTAMDVKARLVEALLERYLVSRSTATPLRPLLELLLQAADAGLLHEELKLALLQDQAVFQMDQVSHFPSTHTSFVFG